MSSSTHSGYLKRLKAPFGAFFLGVMRNIWGFEDLATTDARGESLSFVQEKRRILSRENEMLFGGREKFVQLDDCELLFETRNEGGFFFDSLSGFFDKVGGGFVDVVRVAHSGFESV